MNETETILQTFFDALTGETIVRELTAEEIAALPEITADEIAALPELTEPTQDE